MNVLSRVCLMVRLIGGVAFAIGCASHIARPAPLGRSLDRTPYRAAAETIAVAPEAWARLYGPVLRFYRPSSGQARWLEPRLLPASRGDTAGPRLDSATVRMIIAASGVARLCVRGIAPAEGCEAARGGILRLSAPYAADTQTARVVARFEGVPGPYAPGTAYSGTEVFLLRRAGDAWVIAAHEPAAVP
jgi:hypothetical protein